MKKHYKYIIVTFLLMASLACSLPFLAGDATETAPTEGSTQEPTAEVLPTIAATQNAEGIDPCLVGQWTMDVFALNNKFLDLTHSPNMYVVSPSSMVIEFKANGTYSITGETTIRSDLPNSSDYMQLPGTHSGQGSYSADGSAITIPVSTYKFTYGTMFISIDGEVAESPISSLTFPENFMSPAQSTEYQCSTHSLNITYASPFGQVTEEWAR